jgi:hypothetical protein
MQSQDEAFELNADLFAAAVAVVLGGAIAAVLVERAHDDRFKIVMILSSVVSLTAGLYSVYSAFRLMGPASAGVVARAERAQHRDVELKRQAWLQAAAAFSKNADTSPMEIRLTGSLKSIRDQAEQGLVASDAEKAKHLAAIWSMAACDLDDDPDHVAH